MLRGIRVLDFGRFISAPFCAALLGDLGAEVIRIEPSGGSDDRYVMPVSATGEGALFLQTNRNKRSMTLNMDKPESRPVLEDLIRSADVVIANFPPAVLRKLGLDYASLREIRTDIILTSVSAYGPGPYHETIGFDGTGQALSGGIALTGLPDQPFRAGVSYVDYSTALSAAFGTMAALFKRQATGQGDHVETSLLGNALTMTNPMLIEEAAGARSRIATGNRSPIAGPSDLFATRDGWIMIQVIGQAMFRRWANLLDKPEFIDDPRFVDDMARGVNGEALSAVTAAWCAGRTTEAALAALRACRLPASSVLAPAQVLQAPEVTQGEALSFYAQPGIDSKIPLVAAPVRLADVEQRPLAPAPPLDADTDAILNELGYSRQDIESLRRSGAI